MFGIGGNGKKLSGDSEQISGLLGKSVSISGKLTCEGVVRIDGSFQGEIDSQGTLIIGEGAVVDARIKVDTIMITGEVKGEIDAADRIELRKPCKLLGNIKTPNLIIGEGVVFEGNCEMGTIRDSVVAHIPVDSREADIS